MAESLRALVDAVEVLRAWGRAERDDVSIHAAGRLVREAREAALREAAHLFAHAATYSGETVISRILSLLDAAPDAEVK